MRLRSGGRLAGALALVGVLLAACGREPATGDADDVVVGAGPDVWKSVQSRVKAKLEPSRIARGRKDFQVVYQDPTEPEWPERRKARQILLIGRPTDPWMEAALPQAEAPADLPAIVEVDDLWATPQQVTILELPETDPRAAVTSRLDSVRARLEERYRAAVLTELFANGADQALADSLLESDGFTLLVPTAFESGYEEGVFSFRKAEDAAGVARQVTVTWKSPVPPGLQGQALLDWRAQALRSTGTGQAVALANVDATQTTHRGNVAYQLLGNWASTRVKGQRGPFILRAVFCPTQDRVYLVDGWLLAPDEERHRHLVELESILNSFRCGSARSAQPSE